jgi:thiamine-monophosphate kinase
MTGPHRGPSGEEGGSCDPGDSDSRESTVIRALYAHAPVNGDLWVPAGDDAAVLKDGRCWTCDTLVEGVHWDHRLNAEDVGFKAVAVSISDLAVMGAKPHWALLSLALPDPLDVGFVEGFARGFGGACERWGVTLAGGDTTRGRGACVVTVTMGGSLQAQPLTRSGAKEGDDLWVTGIPGLAALGYSLEAPGPDALQALRRPEPPLAFSLQLAAEGLATAAMDLSDGLRSDLPRLCAASRVGALLHVHQLPAHPEFDGQVLARAAQLAGGDDYEVLFTAPQTHARRIQALAKAHHVVATCVGTLTGNEDVRVDEGSWPAAPYQHFKGTV